MKLTSKTRMAIKIITILARDGKSKGKDIAKEVNISAPYFEQCVAPLINKGYVESIRGCEGGYQIGPEFEGVKVFDIESLFCSEVPDDHTHNTVNEVLKMLPVI